MASKKNKLKTNGNIFVGHSIKEKKSVSAGDNSIVVGGSVQGSNIIMGNKNFVSNQSVNLSPLFETIYDFVETHPKLQAGKKHDAIEELKEIQTALEDPKPDESFITRRFRNLKRMAPDIVDVAMETLKNPLSGVAEVMKKVSNKLSEKAK